ncbi:MAG: nucleoside hydrolase [Balneola sp.]|nr:MAG: nucleoside hydrolase [Balneola sp.]
MKKYLSLILIGILSVPNVAAQSKIIFDTDFGGDADDLGALAMIHNLQSHGETELLAVMCWSTEEYAVSGIDAVNTFYGRPHIPIGVRKDGKFHEPWNHSKPITEVLPFNESYDSATEAVALYRKLLSDADENSITIITVGPLANIKNLLESEPDSNSPLSGKELINQKVSEFVIMGGQYPEGEWEWNFNGNMEGVTRFVIENLKEVPVTFLGYEVGLVIKTGEVFNELETSHPLYIGYKHFSEFAPWIKENYKGRILDNSSYDQTAILYAVRNGLGDYWDRVDNGFNKADDEGGNIWVEGEKTNHSYLTLLKDPEEMATIIESLMLGNLE